MTTNTTPATPTTPGVTNTQGLAAWAAPYITTMLGNAQALAQKPYEVYQGPLTAGASELQTKAFQGIGALSVPGALPGITSQIGNVANQAGGMSYSPTSFTSGFQAPGSYAANDFSNVQFKAPDQYTSVGGSFTDAGVAQKYMNPYVQQALDPTLKELQRQAAVNLQPQMAQLARAGAFGGSRDAILRAEANRNLLDQIAETTGQGYSTAFREAQAQFNAEQARKIQEAQFGAAQGMTRAELEARYGLEAARAAEQSRQFGASQSMTAADLAARYGLDAQRLSEQSKQFGAQYGLDALSKQLQALEGQGRLTLDQANLERAILGQQLTAGDTQRAIEAEGVAADLAEFNRQKDFEYKQLQFMRDMISGLPIGSVTSNPAAMTGIAQLITAAGGLDKLLEDTGFGSLQELLEGIFSGNFGGGSETTAP